jgi:hypothetical protein
LARSTSWFFASTCLFCHDSRFGLLSELLVLGAQLFLLSAQQIFRALQRRRLLFETIVGLLQLALLALQLSGQQLRLCEQRLGLHVRSQRVEHDADALHQLIEETACEPH